MNSESGPVLAAEPRRTLKIESDGKTLNYVDSVTGKSAASVFIKPGDVVHWEFSGGNFAILFNDHSPFREAGFTGKRAQTIGSVVTSQVKGRYVYTVLAIPEKGPTITSDPVLIMDDGS